MAKESLDSALAVELLEVKEELEQVELEYHNSTAEITKLENRIADLKGKGAKLEELRVKFDKMLDDNEVSDTLRRLFRVNIVRDLVKTPVVEKLKKTPTSAQTKAFYQTALAHGPKTVKELKEAFKRAGWESGLRPDLSKDLELQGDKYALKKK